MSTQEPALQPEKKDAEELSYLYDFVCECPNPRISEALRRLVNHWLLSTRTVPEFSALLKRTLELTSDETVEICWLLAINPKTPPSVLQDLCTGASSELLERIAENTNTGASTLSELSYQAVAEIRIAAAGNTSTPIASIMMLTMDDDADVRFSIAENSQAPKEALEVLCSDDNPYIKMRASVTLARAELVRDVFEKGQKQS